MNLVAAKTLLMRERLDWRRPHLNWVPEQLYNFFKTKR